MALALGGTRQRATGGILIVVLSVFSNGTLPGC
jgi:hypothetical protein